MKNNISYYSHDCDSHDHRKFKKLVGRYGLAGEGAFWRLNNLIGKSDGCLLDLTDEITQIDTADVLKMSFKQLDEFVAYLLECKLIYYIGDAITTDRCQDTLADLNRKRTYARNKKVTNNSPEVTGNLGKSYHENSKSSHEKQPNFRIKKERKKERGEFNSPIDQKANPSDIPGFVQLEKELTAS